MNRNIVKKVVQIINDCTREDGWAQQAQVCKVCKQEGIDVRRSGTTPTDFFSKLDPTIECGRDNNGLPILRVKRDRFPLKKINKNVLSKFYNDLPDLGHGWKNYDVFLDQIKERYEINDEKEFHSLLTSFAPNIKYFDKPFGFTDDKGEFNYCKAFRTSDFYMKFTNSVYIPKKDVESDKNRLLPLQRINKDVLSELYNNLPDLGNGWKNFDMYSSQIKERYKINDEEEFISYLCSFAPNIKFFNKPFVFTDDSGKLNYCKAFRTSDFDMKLTDFAYFPKKDFDSDKNGFLQAVEVLAQEKVLKEDWAYKDQNNRNYPILKSYLLRTFERLLSEDERHNSDVHWKTKIRYSDDKNYVVFNTGLVDSLFEPVFAFFQKSTKASIMAKYKYTFKCFVKSNDSEHQMLTRIFGSDLPEPAHYYDDTSELVYNIKSDIGTFNWNHIIERCERLPIEFLQDNGPKNFDYENITEDFYKRLSQAILADSRSYNCIKNRIVDAVNYAIKRVRWNFKTAIPMYYPSAEQISLLLPLSLGSEDKIDVALVLESTQSGAYIAHTILTLKMAYNNARLITRPDSDWLVAKNIISTNEEGIDSDED